MSKIYEKDGEEVKMYHDFGTIDKVGRINELNSLIQSKGKEITILESEIDLLEEEVDTLENI